MVLLMAGIPLHAATKSAPSEAVSTKPDEDPDGDGLTNQEEAEMGANPWNPDTDGDGVTDGQDGWAGGSDKDFEKCLAPKRLPKPHFAAIDMGEGYPLLLSNAGTAVIYFYNSPGNCTFSFWENGQLTTILPPTPGSYMLTPDDVNSRGDILLHVTDYTRNVYERVDPDSPVWFSIRNSDRHYVWNRGSYRELTPPGVAPSSWADMVTFANGATGIQAPEGTPLGTSDLPDIIYKSGDFYWGVGTCSLDDAGWVAGTEGESAYDNYSRRSPFYSLRRQVSQYSGAVWKSGEATPIGTSTISMRVNESSDQNIPPENLNFVYPSPCRSFPILNNKNGDVVWRTVTYTYDCNLLSSTLSLGTMDSVGIPYTHLTPQQLIRDESNRLHVFGINPNDNKCYLNVDCGDTMVSPKESFPSNVNRRFQAVSGKKLWQNYKWETIPDDLGKGLTLSYLKEINDKGTILASATAADGKAHAVLLVPVDIAVDANRDGVIKFAGNYGDSAVAGKPADVTTQDKPFRFWLNDDDDKGAMGSEQMPVANPDNSDNQIGSVRDLEDFTRLWLHVGAFYDEISKGTFKVGLKWKNTNGTSPSVKVYKSADPNGSDDYLKDEQAGADQFAAEYRTAIATVTGSSAVVLPADFWTGYSEVNPKRCLLFEGITEGKGQLCITIHKADGTLIGEGAGVWLDLVNVRKMFQRVKATGIADNAPEPSQDANNQPAEPAMGWVADDNGQPYDENAAKSWQETKQYIVFVHGWNMSYDESENFAETMFKRLWQRGYKGRFASMRWPTLNDSIPTPIGDVPYTYNASEYRAWKCGESLKQFVNNLPAGYTRNVVAHSMGNVVAGSALKKGMSLTNYALLNAAVSAGCFDDRAILDQGWGYTTPFYDPDPATSSLSHRNQLAGVGGNLVNFFLPADDALLKWEWNNDTPGGLIPGSGNRFVVVGSKPQRYSLGVTGYYYDPSKPAGQRLGTNYPNVNGRFVTTPHECMSYLAQSPMKAAGAEADTAGSIDSAVDMRPYGFDKVHSAEFEFRIHQVTQFYNRMLEECDLPFLP